MILVYTENSSPRVKYIFGFILNEILGIDYELTSDLDVFVKSSLPRINYSEADIHGVVKIAPHSLLFESGIKEQSIYVSDWKDTKVFFQTDLPSDMPFDLFAASFFLLVRYEEYLPHQKDNHERFPAEESMAFKNDFLEEPVIDYWAFHFAGIIKRQYPEFEIPERKYRYIPTIDIDIAYAYKYKGFGRTAGAFIKALVKFDFADNFKRARVLSGLESDPYDTYVFFEKLHNCYNLSPVLFFLVGRYAEFDKNHSIKKKEYRDLIKKISDKAQVGLHPSYASNSDYNVLKREVEEFSQLIGEKVEKSRQHFLKLTIPETYRNLLKAGIRQDYSMGFASKPGFRAGTCTPFHFYDLEREEQTALQILSFQVMDGTLNQYEKLNPEEALGKIQKLASAVKGVNGTFISLWHNSSVGEQREWSGWLGVYEEMLKICNPE